MQEYQVTGPNGVVYTAQLDEATAKKLGAKAVKAPANKAAKKPANKAAAKKADK